MENILIVTVKEWNISNYFRLKNRYAKKYNFHIITSKEEFTFEYIQSINPKYIFFPHWSWLIEKKIYESYECVVFHMTDLPYGRGGSPFQNLIINQIYDTKITALKVDETLDGGDIYLKEECNISIGSAEENFIKISNIIFDKMISKFLTDKIEPKKQVGEATFFKRRLPSQSDINTLEDISMGKLYDFIRMLDAQGYPKAYIDVGKYKIEFSEVNLKNNKLTGRFEVIEYE